MRVTQEVGVMGAVVGAVVGAMMGAMIGSVSLVGGIVFLVLLVTLVLPVWALIDAISRPNGAFLAAGSSKGMWIALIAIFWFFTGVVGLILSIVYLASIRPRVKAVMT